MKNLIIAILAIATVVVGYIAAADRLRLTLEGVEGKTAKVLRGDLTLPINATGEVRPARRVEIKAEASGEVTEIFKQAGDRIRAGELLIRLLRDDEQRSVNSARQDLKRAAARLEIAKIALLQAQTSDRESAEAKVAEIEATLAFSEYRKAKLDDTDEAYRQVEEVKQREMTVLTQRAQLDSAHANLDRVLLAARRAEQETAQAEASYATAQNTLADAERRLEKTDIVSPIDGIVGAIEKQVGEVIQGGKTTFTGGTVLAVLLDMDRLVVRAEVDESDIARILAIAPAWAKPGNDGSVPMPDDLQAATEAVEHPPVITVESFRDEEFAGVIERVFPEPRVLSGVVTYLTDVVLTGENRRQLLPGMRADVRFTSEHVENVLLCPNEAIHENMNGKLGVYIKKKGTLEADREVAFVPCKFGLDNGNYSEVREGLTEGQIVYSKLPAQKDDDDE